MFLFGSTAHLFGVSRNYRRTGDEPDGQGLVLTLEGLIMGAIGKKLMSRALAAANLLQLNGYDFERLERRAEQQIERLEGQRIRAAEQTFAQVTAAQ